MPHADLVRRSLLTLLLMTHAETGGIVAAPTTSLPEDFGGERNWDYRFCWLRDAALTLESLLGAGYAQEALHWRSWLLRAVAGDPADLQIMYTVDGGRQLPERELPHLAGYADSRPVRIGNGAVSQRQNDVLGEVMIALELAREAGLEETHNSWSLQRALVDELAEHWDEPDNGLWEIRGPQRHFTHSRVMVWVAFDRAVKAVEQPRARRPGRAVARAARPGARGDPRQGLRPRARHLHPALRHDRRRRLAADHPAGRVPARRRPAGAGHDRRRDRRPRCTTACCCATAPRRGSTGSRATSTRSSPAPSGSCPPSRRPGAATEATELMDRLCGLANDVGLLSEEYDARHGRMAGNFPQAFSHLTLVQAALALR